ncbi:MAG: amidase domain-containing protein [Firmicutes bacterium]|nr:amidase domain-containing protein [Bacillota bacterium]
MRYDRESAVAYANRWAYFRNPEFFDFSELGGDCTNFASQCLFAGSGVMNYTPIYGWYYINASNRTASWTGVEFLYNFLVNNRGMGPQGEEVELKRIMAGDIVQLKFKEGPDFNHSPVVVDAGDGTPDTVLVAAHSVDSNCRPISSYSYRGIRPIHIFNVGT